MKTKKTENQKPHLIAGGNDGNAFFILGRAGKAAKKAGWSQEKIDQFTNEAKAGDYNHLLRTCMKYFDCD